MKLSAAISPCPNDTFAFWQFLHEPMLGGSCSLDITFADIQQLNTMALNHEKDIIKVSFSVVGHLLDTYELLNSGAAIGFGVGPLLLAAKPLLMNATPPELRIGLPGKDTSAHLLFEYFAQKEKLREKTSIQKTQMVFSDIMTNLKAETIDLGVVIHEGRFVYQQEGLHLVQDLGSYWEQGTGYAVPLGAVLVRRSLPKAVKQDIASGLKRSVNTALVALKEGSEIYRKEILPFVASHAQELDGEVMQNHIITYVNQDTIELSPKSHEAIHFFAGLRKTLLATGVL